QYDGELLTGVAVRGGPLYSSELIMEQWRGPHRPRAFSPSDQMPAHPAVLTRAVANVADAGTGSAWAPRVRGTAKGRRFRSLLAMPMLRAGDVVGVIVVTRERAGGFAPAEVALLQTFADQAVIAVENARLLTALQARNKDLGEALERQTATADILRVISQA